MVHVREGISIPALERLGFTFAHFAPEVPARGPAFRGDLVSAQFSVLLTCHRQAVRRHPFWCEGRLLRGGHFEPSLNAATPAYALRMTQPDQDSAGAHAQAVDADADDNVIGDGASPGAEDIELNDEALEQTSGGKPTHPVHLPPGAKWHFIDPPQSAH